jgi:hypothetical protein
MDEVTRAGLALVFLYTLACRPGAIPMGNDAAEMKQHLVAAKQQALRYFTADAVPEGRAVRALVAQHPGEAWSSLSDEDRFLLYELSPESYASAPAEQRARAYCAGLEGVPFEWWGLPGALTTATAKHLISLGVAAAACLRPRLDATTPLRYLNGEANAMADDLGWVIGDLAADAVAQILGTTFDGREPAAVRAGRRAELGRALETLHRP